MTGEKRLVRLALVWWALVTDKKSSEKARGEAYRAMTEQLRVMTGADRP